MGTKKTHVTINDVAKLSGVSIATVSHVINKNIPVKEKTEKKVREAMDILNFSLDLNARSLRQKQTKTIGMVVSDVSNQFFGQLSKMVEFSLEKNGYGVLLANSNGDIEKEKAQVRILMERRIDGLILVPAGDESSHLVDYLNKDIPIVLIDRSIPGLPLDVVCVNNEDATEELAQHFIDDGHRRIGAISGKLSSTVTSERINGYLNALKNNGILADDSLVCYGQFDVETGYSSTMKLMSSGDPPTAIIACNNLIAVGVIQALLERKKYPQVEVAVWDDSPWMRIMTPKLYAVVKQPIDVLGKTVVDILLKKIRSEEQYEDGKKPTRIVLDVSIDYRN